MKQYQYNKFLPKPHDLSQAQLSLLYAINPDSKQYKHRRLSQSYLE